MTKLALALSALTLFSQATFANPEQELIGTWALKGQSCSNGDAPAASVENMTLTFDGKNVATDIGTAGCNFLIAAPYTVQNGSNVLFTIDKVTQTCGSDTQVFEIEPQSNNLPFVINGNQMRVTADISFLEGVCPSGSSFLVDFEKVP